MAKKRGAKRIQIRSREKSETNMAALGERDGLRQGWNDGYLLGQCEVTRHLIVREFRRWPIKVIYVTAGIGDPYPALDRAIIGTMENLVDQLIVASPGEDVANLASQWKPNLVLALNGVVLPAEQVIRLREQGIPTAIWFTDDPYYTDWTKSIAPRYDYVFTLEKNCVSFYQKLGCPRVYYLPFAVYPPLYYPRRVLTSERSDICFIGVAYHYRVGFFDRMASYLSRKNVLISGLWWDRLTHYALLKEKIRLGKWLNPDETAACYSGARIVLNLHRRHDDETYNRNSAMIPAASINPRTFEIAACGTLQFCDEREELPHFYTPDQEIVTFSSPEELIHKANYYLKNEDHRQEIVLRSLRRTLSQHTYGDRLTQMLETIFPGGASYG